MRFFYCALLLPAFAFAQPKLAPDAPGCADSSSLPKLLGCRVDNCEKKDGDRRDIAVKEDYDHQPVTNSIDGDSRSVMYECVEGTKPKSIVNQAADALRAAGFDVPYLFSDEEGGLTAHKGDLWLTIDSASRFYTLTETKVTPPDFESINDAASMADAIEKYGHVPLYGIHFLSGKADIAPESVTSLRELGFMLDDNPDWNIRIEGHTDNIGSKDVNSELSARRANAVAAYLFGRGIKRTRVRALGAGETDPIASNDTEAGRAKNRRVEIVLLPSTPVNSAQKP
ncbi:MAG TPA: OmpA family protein [Bryobacteraceae bacterium]|nr:OmpA family protein [Bryobacteraceae bacterium]